MSTTCSASWPAARAFQRPSGRQAVGVDVLGRALELGERRDRLAASGAEGWSTSSSSVLSDWTMRGPSFTRQAYGRPHARGVAAALRGRLSWPMRPSAGPGTRRRWRARSSGPSSSGATGWGRCRRRRCRTGARSRCRGGSAPRSQTRVARPIRDSPTSSSATDAVPVGHVHVEVVGVVVGDHRRDRVAGEQVVERADDEPRRRRRRTPRRPAAARAGRTAASSRPRRSPSGAATTGPPGARAGPPRRAARR